MTRAAATLPEQWRNSIVRYADERPDSLLAHPLNPKVHPKTQIDALSGAISEVGWIAPVIVNETTGHVIDGHARIGLAISRGEPSVPVAYVELSEEAERLALATFDPIGSLAGMDSDHLAALLEGLTSADEAVANLLRDLAPVKPKNLNPDDADLTPPTEPITKPGDLWLLVEHRLLCGDATKAEDVTRLMGGEKADVVLTDPPYGIDLDTDFSTIRGSLRSIGASHGTRGNTYAPVHGDAEPYDPAPLFAGFGSAPEMFVFGGDYFADRIPNRSSGSWLVWDKRKDSQSEAVGSEFELIWSKRRHKRRMLRHDWFGFLSSGNAREARNRQHPTQKPTSLLRDILEQWSPSGAVVADPYLGSGSTLIAAEQLGRRCYAMEIEPAYVDVAVRRWERLTGGQAVKAHA